MALPVAMALLVVLSAPVKAQLPDDAPPLPADPATVVAVVGQSAILWGDIHPKVETRIKEGIAKAGQQIPEAQLTMVRTQLSRAALRSAIQNKVMSECFLLEQVGTQSADKREEVSNMMSQRARQLFFESELKQLKEKYATESLNEIDAKLRESGTSLQSRQREFADQMLGHMFMKENIDQDPNVTIAEIKRYYEKHIDDYRHGAKAKWEQLSVLFKNHPTRQAALDKLTAMGRDVYYWEQLNLLPENDPSRKTMTDRLTAVGGINFNKSWEQTARAGSEESYSADGGQHDWTTQGSLASKELDQQIFSMPINKMSEIIEDSNGLHIIRVKDRTPAGVTSLADVQDDIRKAIKKEKIMAAQEKMVEQMQSRVPVWSIYPDDFPGAKPLRISAAPQTTTQR